jgi:hypothetical protein
MYDLVGFVLVGPVSAAQFMQRTDSPARALPVEHDLA